MSKIPISGATSLQVQSISGRPILAGFCNREGSNRITRSKTQIWISNKNRNMTLMTDSLESQVGLSHTHTTTQDSRDHPSSSRTIWTFTTNWNRGDTKGMDTRGDNSNREDMGTHMEYSQG